MSYSLIILYYDGNKNFIGGISNSNTYTFTPVAGARFIKVCTFPSYGGTYKHDICINLSDPSKNGTYEPYVVNTKDISFYKSIKDGQGNTLSPNGLLSAGSVCDEGYKEDWNLHVYRK